MTRQLFVSVVLAGLMASAAWAQSAPPAAPATTAPADSAVAPGQCPVSGATSPATQPADAGAVCPVTGATNSTTQPAPPAGETKMSPEMAELLGLKPPATQPTTPPKPAKSATISIQAVQGTQGGPAITGGKATVQLFREVGEPQTIEVNLDKHGVAILEDLSLITPFQPAVTIEYAGCSYQTVGSVMTPTAARQKIEVPVYETTEQKPELTILMRRIWAMPADNGVRVIDIMTVKNPADRSWLGDKDADGKRSTVWTALPPGATNEEMEGGFHSRCARREGDKLVSSAPVVPGQTEYRLTYQVPATDGKVNVTFDTPMPVMGGVILMMPESQAGGAVVTGLEPRGTSQPRGYRMPMRSYVGTGIASGHKITLALSEAALAAHAQGGEGFWTGPKLVGAVGGAIVLLLCLVLVIKAGRKAGQSGPDAKA